MAYGDDKDLFISQHERIQRGNIDPKQLLKEKIEQKMGANVRYAEVELKTEMDLKQLQMQLAGKQDAEQKRVQQMNEDAKSKELFHIGEKTLKEEEDERMEPQLQVSPDQLQKQAQEEEGPDEVEEVYDAAG